MTEKILYIDMDNVLVDFKSGINRLTDLELEICGGKDFDEVPGIFARMDPMPGAIESLLALHASKKFEIYLLSTAPWNNPSAWHDKIVWVQKHFGSDKEAPFHKRLILSHHKNLNRGDYLVDDREANGAKDFIGKHIHFGQAEFPDWESVVNYLLAQVD